MTGSGRPTLYKLERASRARELCARRHQLRGNAPVGRDAKMTGGKGAKGGNLESLGNSGLSTMARSGGNWRKPLVPVQVRPRSVP
jgi:hypothetical protein